ncbi:MAG: GntR family transcriptional regulator [Clostridiaceae bacterium]|nr:GntR family transcriptional regulator [Clostridiaceae bacterium]
MVSNNSDIKGLQPIRSKGQMNLSDQVESSLINFIRLNNLSAGDILPSQSLLAKSLGVSSSTLRETLSRLEERGIIIVEHGKGTFLNRSSDQLETQIDMNLSTSQMIIDQGLVPGTKDIQATEEKLPKYFWGCFGENDNQHLYLLIQRVRTANDKPLVYSTAYLHRKFFKFREELSNYYGSLYEFINIRTTDAIVSTNAKIFAKSADDFLATKLRVDLYSPLLVLQQIHLNNVDEVIFVSREYYSHSYIKLKVTINNKQ